MNLKIRIEIENYLWIFCVRKMLSLGSSKPWPDALEIITGQRKMEASALVEYFKPLLDWLEKKNQETGAHIGWNSEFGINFNTFLNCSKYKLENFLFFLHCRVSIEVRCRKGKAIAVSSYHEFIKLFFLFMQSFFFFCIVNFYLAFI